MGVSGFGFKLWGVQSSGFEGLRVLGSGFRVLARWHSAHRLQYPLTKGYTLNHNRIPSMISGKFLN